MPALNQDIKIHHTMLLLVKVWRCCWQYEPVQALSVLSCTTFCACSSIPHTQTTIKCVATPRFISVCLCVYGCLCAMCTFLLACILCGQLCYSGYFVSDCIAADMSLKPYAVCQCKLVSWHSVNMTTSLVYNIARERGERVLVGCKTTTPTVSYRFYVSQSHAWERLLVCVCVCVLKVHVYLCVRCVWTVHLYP